MTEYPRTYHGFCRLLCNFPQDRAGGEAQGGNGLFPELWGWRLQSPSTLDCFPKMPKTLSCWQPWHMEDTFPTPPPHKTILQGWLLQQEHLIALPTPSDGRSRFCTILFDNLFRTSTILSSWLSGLVCQYLELSQGHVDHGFQASKKWLQTLGLFSTHLCPSAWLMRQRWPAVWTQKQCKSTPKLTNLLIALVGWEADGKPTLSVFGLLLVWKMTSLSSENGK